MKNGVKKWSFSSSQYVQNAVKNVEVYLRDSGETLLKHWTSPLTLDYRPEVDVRPELGSKQAAYYQSLIGALRWIVEIGRADITMEVSVMAVTCNNCFICLYF